MAPYVDPAIWYAQLPPCYMAAGMLITDTDGRVLIVKPNYRDHWGIPGGTAEAGEAPHVTCAREIKEELGLILKAGPLLIIDWMPATASRLRPMAYYLFDGGTAVDSDIKLQTEELDAYGFFPPDEAVARLAPDAAYRLPAALAARETGQTVYAPTDTPPGLAVGNDRRPTGMSQSAQTVSASGKGS